MSKIDMKIWKCTENASCYNCILNWLYCTYTHTNQFQKNNNNSNQSISNRPTRELKCLPQGWSWLLFLRTYISCVLTNLILMSIPIVTQHESRQQQILSTCDGPDGLFNECCAYHFTGTTQSFIYIIKSSIEHVKYHHESNEFVPAGFCAGTHCTQHTHTDIKLLKFPVCYS